LNRRYVFYGAPAAGSSGGTFIPPVELAAGGQICKKKFRHIFLKNQKINNIKNRKTRSLCEVGWAVEVDRDGPRIRPQAGLRVATAREYLGSTGLIQTWSGPP